MNLNSFAYEIENELQSQSKDAKPNGKATESKKKAVEPLFVMIDSISAQKIEWLWETRIAFGRLSLIDGDPGVGKTLFTHAVTSAVSRGDALPGGKKPSGPANVVLFSVEDGFADTVRPRLDALGADVSRIAIPNPKRGLAPSLMNASYIEQIVKDVGPALVIIDPIIAFSAKRDTDRASQVRELLSPLAMMAERYSFACIIIRHLNKQGGFNALYRGSGSIDFMAACRSAFLIAENDTGERVFAHVKNSLGPKAPSITFTIKERNGVALFQWGDEVSTTAEELLQQSQVQTRGRGRAQLDAAKRFLEEILCNAPMPSNDIREKAEGAGISNATLWRAKETLDIKASKERKTGEWWWRLP
jgi:predicted ATP-dependent serine protease